MFKVLIFSDLHCHAHKRSLDRLHDCLKALEWVFLTALEKNLTDIIFAGDLFQDRQKIDVLTYHLTFDLFNKYCKKGLKCWLLLGNHDLWYHDKWDISSVWPLSAIDGVYVIDKPSTLKILGCEVDFLPYTHDPIEHLKTLKSHKTLIGHLALDGAKLNRFHNTHADVVIEHDGEMVPVNAECFSAWDQVFLGHYHCNQNIEPNIEYIGSLLQLNFGEAFQHKHIIIYDLKTGEKEYIRNTFSPQHFIIPEADIKKYDIEKNFIRITTTDISSTNLIEVKQELQKLKPGTLEIVPLPKHENTHLVEDAKAILYKEDEMLERYADQVDIGELDKPILISVGKKICLMESVS